MIGTSAQRSHRWLEQLRQLHEASAEHDWAALAAEVNRRFALAGKAELKPSIPGVPPIWFQGNIERVQPGHWVLVLSLNHQLPNPGAYAAVTRQTAWQTWCMHHRDHWYESFFGPLARVAAGGMGVDIDPSDVSAYASDHVVFTELCPYASGSFALDAEAIADLVQSDPAFRTAARIRSVLLDEAWPGLVLVNGTGAMHAFALAHRARFAWRSPRRTYISKGSPRAGHPPKTLWHQEGIYTAPTGRVPVVGFPFLRKPRTHNSYGEIAQLAEQVRRFKQSFEYDHGTRGDRSEQHPE